MAPLACFDVAGTLQGQSVLIDPLANDWDANADIMTLASVADPPAGSVTIDDQGRLRYTPDASFSGFDSFTYLVTDPTGALGLGYVGVVVSNARNHGLPPALLIAEPSRPAAATVVISQTATVDLTLPADSYTTPIADDDVFFLAYLNWQRPAANVGAAAAGLRYLNRGFTLQAYMSQHAKPDTLLAKPLRVTLRYAEVELGGWTKTS